MQISSVTSGIAPLRPSLPSTPSAAPNPAGADFGDALKQAVGALQQLGGQADASSLALAKGDPIDIHEVMLANEQASLGFSMAVQVRNKLVDAYSEIMRMSV
jgi:flagellar hook-basal body complex protein FliE